MAEVTVHPVLETVAAFLRLIEDRTGPADNAERELRALCDRMVDQMSSITSECDDTDYTDPPDRDYKEVEALVSERFPDFGYYAEAESVLREKDSQGLLTCDAIDDISDIALEFIEFQWRLENTSTQDALWHLRLRYDSHWQAHLRGLRFYLDQRESR